MTELKLAGIAKHENKGERQVRLLMPLAFVSPQAVRRMMSGGTMPIGVMELARAVPLVWEANGGL